MFTGGSIFTVSRKVCYAMLAALRCLVNFFLTLLTPASSTGGIYMWNPMDDEFEYPEDSRKPNYLHLETVPPREAFQPLIDDFRQLRKLAPSAGQTPISTDISSLRGPENFDKKGSLALYEAGRKLWEALCKLKSFYVECGWDDNALVQTEFRRDEFVDNRAKYWDEVVEPLEEESRKASDFYRMKN